MLKILKNKKYVIAAIVLLILLIGVLAFFLLRNKDEPADPEERFYSQLTGLEVPREVSEAPILGVIIENSTQSRPQTGLDAAGIVFEAVTEGGITRYLALYQEDVPEIVGPVRSLRPHLLDWAMGFDASFAHIGGSPEALSTADDRGAKHLNQFTYNKPYYRDSGRPSPHNLYARTADLQALQADLGHGTSQFAEIPRKSDNPAEEPVATTIEVDYAGASFKVEFRYDAETNRYTRYLAGDPHMDAATDEPITVKNVIVIKTVQQAAGTNAIGEGEAILFMDGNALNLRWQKQSHEERIRIVDAEGKQVALNRGDTWISALPNSRSVNY